MYLLTHSLMSSWLYVLKEHSSEESYQDFLRTLNREPSTPTEAMQKGLDFEAYVTALLEDRGDIEHPWYGAGRAISDRIRGAQLQVSAKREIQIGNTDVLLYGRLDALRAGIITDIKFSSRYEAGKYFDSTQHPMYLKLVPSAYAFEYLITDGQNVFSEFYHREDAPDIKYTAANFLDWLDVSRLMETYKEKWTAK